MMKTLLIGLAIAAIATEASAISRYDASRLSCGEVRSIVQQEGAAIMRYKSARTGAQLYGRYVRDGGFCATSERPEASYINTADRSQCYVQECKPFDIEDDELLLNR